MIASDTPLDWRLAFTRGEVSRDELWRRLRDRHLLIAQHSQLLQGTGISELLIEATGLAVRLKNGLSFALDPEAVREAANVILAQGEYEAFESKLLLRLAKGARTIFDIGANIGWHALHLAQQEDKARVLAFEPVPSTHARLLVNLARNESGRRVEPVATGFSDAPGAFDMFVPNASGSPAASLNELHPREGSRKVTCQFTTLDAFAAERGIDDLDLIKCDVEGAELLVLRGGAAAIARCRPLVVIEILRKWSHAFGSHPNDVIAYFSALGYACYGIGEDDLNPIESVTDTTVETNYVFLDPQRHSPAETLVAEARHEYGS